MVSTIYRVTVTFYPNVIDLYTRTASNILGFLFFFLSVLSGVGLLGDMNGGGGGGC